MNRRQFLRTLTACGVGATVAPVDTLVELASPFVDPAESYATLYTAMLTVTRQEFQSRLIDNIVAESEPLWWSKELEQP